MLLSRIKNVAQAVCTQEKEIAEDNTSYLGELACRRLRALGLGPTHGHRFARQPVLLPRHFPPGVVRCSVVVEVDEEEAAVLGGRLGVLQEGAGVKASRER
jgi:hypothetical protein